MDVTFMRENGESFTMEVGFFDTFLEVKKKIEKYHNIPISKQLLFFNNQLFKDDEIILQTDLTITSTIHLKLKDHQQVSNDSNAYVSMPNNATAPLQPENAPVTVPVMPTLSKKLSLNVVPMAIRGKGAFLVKEIESCAKVSELKKFLEGSNMYSNVIPEDRCYFFIHKQSVMYEDQSFEWHGVKEDDTIELFDGQVLD
ncbi:ubiquitin family protein [Trifolium pratense]|uniref:Ubiquitin family protein n=1 Tax=Trifolium pratense TaxID=57577 RepID=A0A2K3LPL6_TRIPR|nr:ubiquitin family protein [Trifolium pratense]